MLACFLGLCVQVICAEKQSSLLLWCRCQSPCSLQTGSQNFSSPREAMKSPLAKRLFQIDGVTNVFFGTDFVTVTKDEEYTWRVLKPDVFAAIMDHFTSGGLQQQTGGSASH